MKSMCGKNTIDIISLKRPTALDKLAEIISKPKGAIPNFGLPKWKVMPLESKIPMVPGPEGAYNFTRRKVGKKLWVSGPYSKFNLSDPYCYEMKLDYDPLHDKNLVPFFSKPRNIRHLMKVGLITNNLDAKCSLRDYNMYRKYLRKLHCDSIKEELRKRSRLCDEERAIQFAEQQAQREVKKLKEREKLVEASKSIIEKQKLAEKLKRQEQREKQQQIQKRLELLALTKEQDKRLQYAKSKERSEYIQQKRKAAADIERRKIIKTLLDWNRKEQIRRKMREARLIHEREEKRKIVEQKWKVRQEFQEKQIEKEQLLLQCINNQREEFLKTYNERIAKETKRMQRLLERMKIFVRCYVARKLPGGKERICCRKYAQDNVSKTENETRLPHTVKPHSILSQYEKSKATSREIKNIKQDKMQLGTKHVAKSKIPIKQNKARKRKKLKKKRRQLLTESDAKDSELNLTQEPQSTPKIEEPSDTSSSTIFDKCRCQIIKHTAKAQHKH